MDVILYNIGTYLKSITFEEEVEGRVEFYKESLNGTSIYIFNPINIKYSNTISVFPFVKPRLVNGIDLLKTTDIRCSLLNYSSFRGKLELLAFADCTMRLVND